MCSITAAISCGRGIEHGRVLDGGRVISSCDSSHGGNGTFIPDMQAAAVMDGVKAASSSTMSMAVSLAIGKAALAASPETGRT